MTVSTIVLDNAAVQALMDETHSEHRRMKDVMRGVNLKAKKHRVAVRVVVPTAVRIEAGCDRTNPKSALFNTQVHEDDDHELTVQRANRAVQLSELVAVSVVDATVGEAAEAFAPSIIYTSDVEDMGRLAGVIAGVVDVEHLSGK